MEIRISVRSLVEFLFRSGDIDNRHAVVSDSAMAEGGRIHRLLQRRSGADYRPEVTIRFTYRTEYYDIILEGRADGIITQEYEGETIVTIDEIKGTYRDIHKQKKAMPMHLAQAKCYAYMYAAQNGLAHIRVRMTYCHIDTEEVIYFHEEYTMAELTAWFEEMMGQYRKWADFAAAWRRKRQDSLKQLAFPFSYREGQKQLVSYVYQTIYHERKLFIEAPTGVGKTISTIFPALKAVGEERAEKIFYLTAKTIARTVAADTFALLRKNGLACKTVILTAKEKICFTGKTECNPPACPYAKGHYDRINDAVYDLLTGKDAYEREAIEEFARKHTVCPFELGLDMSLFADAVICDYNYVFDPHAYLRRFFAEGITGSYLFLIDEAHNLLERGREMYSASLCKEDFLELKKKMKKTKKFPGPVEMHLGKCNKELLFLKRSCKEYEILTDIAPFVAALNKLHKAIRKYLEDTAQKLQTEKEPSAAEKLPMAMPLLEAKEQPAKELQMAKELPMAKEQHAVSWQMQQREELLAFYFELDHFIDIYDGIDDNYVIYTKIEDDSRFILKLFCVNPAKNLRERMAKAVSTILFSATLLPIQYYKKLLGGEETDYEVYAKSAFLPAKKALFIARDVTTRYARRTDEEYYNIALYIREIIKNRHGNYMVFFPSYAFMHRIYEVFEQHFKEDGVECLLQAEHMREEEREDFLGRFAGNADWDIAAAAVAMEIEIETEDEAEERTLLGFCVMGGIFSEGIDLKHEGLIGAVIVGTGIPQVCAEREILKQFFDKRGENGFDYAYRYPGMHKVLQSAGRVIRTVEDIGVVALLDDRFLQSAYLKMFPREWETYEVVTAKQVARRVERFWNEWL